MANIKIERVLHCSSPSGFFAVIQFDFCSYIAVEAILEGALTFMEVSGAVVTEQW